MSYMNVLSCNTTISLHNTETLATADRIKSTHHWRSVLMCLLMDKETNSKKIKPFNSATDTSMGFIDPE